MKISAALFGLFLLTLSFAPAHAQEADLERGNSMLREAIKLIDAGSFDDAWDLLERARKQFPDYSGFRYEQGYILMAQEKYGKAIKAFSEILDAPDATGGYYAMLGNAYDLDGNSEKAIETYKAGIKKFPDSGPLYLELGVMHAKVEDYESAVATWEHGLTVAPTHPSNYYHAARHFMASDFRGWGILYGEIFLNLEPGSDRSMTTRTQLWQAYNDAITLTQTKGEGDTTVVSATNIRFFADAFNIETVDDSTIRVGFPYFYESATRSQMLMITMFSLSLSDGELPTLFPVRKDGLFTIAAIHQFRSMFHDSWSGSNGSKHYDVTLFRYHAKLKKADLFEAYNYFLMFNEHTQEEVSAWLEDNPKGFDKLIAWIEKNPYPRTENPFSRLTMEPVEINASEFESGMGLRIESSASE